MTAEVVAQPHIGWSNVSRAIAHIMFLMRRVSRAFANATAPVPVGYRRLT